LLVGGIVKRILGLPIEERVKVLDLFECDDKILTISNYSDILLALVRAGEFESAISLFARFGCMGCPRIRGPFFIMIRCFCKKNEPDEGIQVLDEMVARGFYPNVVTFTFLIDSLCKRGRLKKAFQIFEMMSRVECEPTVRTYNCLINGLLCR